MNPESQRKLFDADVEREVVALLPSVVKGVKVPWEPAPNCKKCYGKGVVGKDLVTGAPILCSKCYPGLKVSAKDEPPNDAPILVRSRVRW